MRKSGCPQRINGVRIAQRECPPHTHAATTGRPSRPSKKDRGPSCTCAIGAVVMAPARAPIRPAGRGDRALSSADGGSARHHPTDPPPLFVPEAAPSCPPSFARPPSASQPAPPPPRPCRTPQSTATAPAVPVRPLWPRRRRLSGRWCPRARPLAPPGPAAPPSRPTAARLVCRPQQHAPPHLSLHLPATN